MNKSVLLIIAVVVVLGGGGGVLLLKNSDKSKTSTTTQSDMTNSTASSEQTSSSNMVDMQGMAFTPAKTSVKVGTTVTWTNKDSVNHDVSPDSKSADFVGSDLLGKGESYSFTFKKAGTYSYHCSIHPTMKGTIEVTE